MSANPTIADDEPTVFLPQELLATRERLRVEA